MSIFFIIYSCKKPTYIRLTGDNPLIDPEVVNLAIKKYHVSECDYLTNSINRTFPYGTEVEIFSFNSLESAWKNAINNARGDSNKVIVEEFLTFDFVSSIIFTNGNLTVSSHNPRSFAAYLTGAGLLSINNAL